VRRNFKFQVCIMPGPGMIPELGMKPTVHKLHLLKGGSRASEDCLLSFASQEGTIYFGVALLSLPIY
jgi:hypothetical protein